MNWEKNLEDGVFESNEETFQGGLISYGKLCWEVK